MSKQPQPTGERREDFSSKHPNLDTPQDKCSRNNSANFII